MSQINSIDYHLEELKILLDPSSPHYCIPIFTEQDLVVLDIGCGIGQAMGETILSENKVLVGIDIDSTSLHYGKSRYNHIIFVNAKAEQLPFSDNTFDFVISRVSIPYTQIPSSLAEINRVLKPGGRVWLTLHSFSMTWLRFKKSIAKFAIKDLIFRVYVIVNGLLFHYSGKLVNFPYLNKIESFQTRKSIQKCLLRTGFDEINIKKHTHFVCTATKM